jgi:predicted metal-dependent peptidase
VTAPRLDQQRLAAARLWAAHRFPYLASALFATQVRPVDLPGLVAVDESWRVFVDPRLVQAWRAEQLGSVLVHHTGHLLRDHAGRARALGVGRDQARRWTLAADAEINDDLAGADLSFPTEPVLPGSIGCEPGRFAEEYFRAVVEPERQPPPALAGHLPQQVGEECDCGGGCDGQGRPWETGGPSGLRRETAGLLRCQVASEILDHCRGLPPGTVPLGLRRWAEELLGIRVDWRRVLAAEIRRGVAAVAGAVDYSYRRPSRRASVLRDVILPTMRRPVPELAVVVDTSGSMHEALLGEALAQVEALLRTLGLAGRRLPVLPCDACVHAVQRVGAARQVELLGGGGTNMGEGIEAARGLRPAPSVVVVLTDGYTPWPPAAPRGVRVVIGLLREGGPPPPAWARVVRIDEAA